MARKTEEFYLFWDGFCSQWDKCTFTLDGVQYNCAEQAMMHKKALQFGDTKIAEKILKAKQPSVQKGLGRLVNNYDDTVWSENRYDIVIDINIAKFSQNPKLLKQLLALDHLIIVEASPEDKIWGIGLDESHPNATIPSKWKGLNLLGKVLMEVRDTLKNS